ncbi:MAG TPA: hypothetical protein VFF03_04760 [Rhodocyclaceae bacterium]|nr:hypothetical protein [Rhodocyclaceae bacterium]
MYLSRIFAASAALALVGCATAPPMTADRIAEIRTGVRSVTFVQNGAEPLSYAVGALDGKSSWAGTQIQFQPGTSAKADVQGAAAANLVFAIGGAIARESMKDDPDYYPRLLRELVGERKFANEIAPRVWPTFARAWQVTYDPEKVVVMPTGKDIPEKDDLYVGDDPGTDLVLMYSLDSFMLSEKPEMSVLWKAVFTAGMYDRPVVPYIRSRMLVYKRDTDGRLHRVWGGICYEGDFFNADFAVQFPLLKAEPQRAGPMFDSAVVMAADTCSKALKPLL